MNECNHKWTRRGMLAALILLPAAAGCQRAAQSTDTPYAEYGARTVQIGLNVIWKRNITPLTLNLQDDGSCDQYAYAIRRSTTEARNLISKIPELTVTFLEGVQACLRAWDNYAVVLEQHPDRRFLVKGAESFMRGFGGDITGGAFIQKEREDRWLKTALDAERAAWDALQRVHYLK